MDVRGGKPDGAADPVAGLDPPVDLPGPAEQQGRLAWLSGGQQVADLGRGKGRAVRFRRLGHDGDAETQPLSHRFQQRGIAAPAAAEHEIIADHHMGDAEPLVQHGLDEFLGAERRHRRVEMQAHREVAAERRHFAHLGAEGRQPERRRVRPEILARMRLERDDAEALAGRHRARPHDHRLMAAMHPVEIADGEDGAAPIRGQRGDVPEDLHHVACLARTPGWIKRASVRAAHRVGSRGFGTSSAREIWNSSSTPPLRDVWYFAVPSARLKPGTMLAKIMLDEPLLLGRARDGKPFALLDICPHRGIPLHYGKFDGCEVECCYHGWRFDPTGACTAIPPVARRADSVAVEDPRPRLSGAGGAGLRLGILRRQAGNRAARTGAGGIRGAAPEARRSHDVRRFDGPCGDRPHGPGHGSYVHKSWYWRKHPRLKEKEFGPAPWGFTMKRHAPSANSRAYRLLGGGGTRTTEITFRLPGVRWEHTEAGRHRMFQLTTLTPINGGQTEINHLVYWTMPWLTPLRPLLRLLVRNFLGQDRAIVVRQQEGLKYQPQLLLLGDPDVQARWYYRLKNEFVRARDEAREFVNPIRERVLKWRS